MDGTWRPENIGFLLTICLCLVAKGPGKDLYINDCHHQYGCTFEFTQSLCDLKELVNVRLSRKQWFSGHHFRIEAANSPNVHFPGVSGFEINLHTIPFIIHVVCCCLSSYFPYWVSPTRSSGALYHRVAT